jgi:sporulation protein YunB
VRKVSSGYKAFLIVAGVVVLLVWLVSLVERAIIPTLVAISEIEVTRVANQVMVDAVSQHIEDLLSGKTLLDFKTGPAGDLLYVQTNAAALNRIQVEVLSVLQETFKSLSGFKVYVPLGQTLGSRILAPLGPRIPVTLYPYGTIRVQVEDSYDVTGINQTRFEISLKVTCMVRVIIPLISARTEVTSRIPLTTVLIPGKVPNTYLSIPK